MLIESIGTWLIQQAAREGFSTVVDAAKRNDAQAAANKAFASALEITDNSLSRTATGLPALLAVKIHLFFRVLEGALAGRIAAQDRAVLLLPPSAEQAAASSSRSSNCSTVTRAPMEWWRGWPSRSLPS